VLLGDSIFDNRAYTGGAPDVVGHLRELLPAVWRATLCAVDGSTAADLPKQFASVPSDGSHVVISIGGNDALLNSDLLGMSVNSTAEALSLFGDRTSQFEQSYRAAIDGALSMGRDTTVCTIYNGNLEAREAALARVALMMFNDVILRVAFERGLRVIDLRLVCTEAADYANPIEPSGRGGRKIAQAIARSLGAANAQVHPATVYAG
jgi:GDSL-like lipase/acylhydrolase family protein